MVSNYYFGYYSLWFIRVVSVLYINHPPDSAYEPTIRDGINSKCISGVVRKSSPYIS